MITDKKVKHDFFSKSLMAEDNESNDYNSKYTISQENIDSINYNQLVDSYSCGNTTEVIRLTETLEKSGRQDLINKFNLFKNTFELEKQHKIDQVFINDISKIIDTSKIQPDLMPYLVSIEKRLQNLESKLLN